MARFWLFGLAFLVYAVCNSHSSKGLNSGFCRRAGAPGGGDGSTILRSLGSFRNRWEFRNQSKMVNLSLLLVLGGGIGAGRWTNGQWGSRPDPLPAGPALATVSGWSLRDQSI
jgi:hypothetical protein